MAASFRSIATAVGVVGFFCTSLAFCPALYFRSENASEPASPAPGTAGAVMIAASSANRQSGSPELHCVVAAPGALTGRALIASMFA